MGFFTFTYIAIGVILAIRSIMEMFQGDKNTEDRKMTIATLLFTGVWLVPFTIFCWPLALLLGWMNDKIES